MLCLTCSSNNKECYKPTIESFSKPCNETQKYCFSTHDEHGVERGCISDISTAYTNCQKNNLTCSLCHEKNCNNVEYNDPNSANLITGTNSLLLIILAFYLKNIY